MSNLPPITDHAFMREVRRHCEDLSRSMPEIAADLGCTSLELVAWIEAYKEPSRPKPYRGKSMSADRVTGWSRDAAAFVAWKREHDGVKQTRERA